MLELRKVSVYYDQVKALEDIYITVTEKESVCVLGANGAGKTSLLRAISGLNSCVGEIIFQGKRIDSELPDAIVRLGIAHIPQGRRIFSDLTVRENFLVGAFTIKNKYEVMANIERVVNYFPVLKERIAQKGGTLSGGEQQMLSIARALMAKPKLLLMDEPSLGLAPKLVAGVCNIIKQLQKDGISILLVEQNIRIAFAVSTRGFILQNGKIVLSGGVEDFLHNDLVRKSYLGR